MPGVFISYRRDDSAGYAGALARELAMRLGPERVFMDIKDIEGGIKFPEAITQAIDSSEVVLVLVGSHWFDAKDEEGRRRLDKPDDFVRQEVVRALSSKARVIPVLLDGAHLPAAEQLPYDLRSLGSREAMELRNSHWDLDMPQLLASVREGMYALDIQETADKKVGKDFDPSAPNSYGTFWLSIVGLTFLASGLVMLVIQLRFLAHAKTASARVVNLLRERDQSDQDDGYYYRPELEYVTPAGERVRFTLSSASNPPAYYVGELVPILFDPGRPSSAIPNTFWGCWWAVIVFGGVGIMMSPIDFLRRAVRGHRVRRLLRDGRPIMTAYHSVEENTAVEVNGRHPFHVVTQWRNPLSQELVHFRSPALFQDPTFKASGQMITVIVDPNNFHRYLMDLSFLHRGAARPVPRL